MKGPRLVEGKLSRPNPPTPRKAPTSTRRTTTARSELVQVLLAAGPGAHTVPPRPVSHTLGHTFLWRAVRFRSIFSTRVSNVSFLFGLCFRSVLVSGESPLRVRLIVQGVLKREVMTEVPQSDHFGNLPFYLTAGHIWDHPEELV